MQWFRRNGPLDLSALVGDGARGFALALAEDPLRLELPPLHEGGGAPDPAALRMLGALYLAAELEQAGLVPVAELLARERFSLSVSDRAAALLESFAQSQRDWPDAATRARLYARLFGLGPAATNEEGIAVNRQFQQRLADLCTAFVESADEPPAGAAGEVTLRRAALALLLNLGPRQYGATQPFGRRLHAQIQAAVALLAEPGIGAPFRARGVWETVRAILGPDAPDLGRFVDRGESGRRLLEWLAAVQPRLADDAAGRPLLPAEAAAVRAAVTWLTASGIRPPALVGRMV